MQVQQQFTRQSLSLIIETSPISVLAHRSHTPGLSHMQGKANLRVSVGQKDGFSLSNNSFTNIYRLSNQCEQSSFDQVFPSDEDSNRRQRSATRSKPIKPKKLLSRYNPFIKAHRTDYLRGLQEELNQTCQLFSTRLRAPSALLSSVSTT